MRNILLLTVVLVMGLVTGCASTGYRSDVEVTPLAGKDTYQISVKVIQIKKSLSGGNDEIPLYNVPNNTWDKGKPQKAEVMSADGRTKVVIETFVPTNDKDGTNYVVRVTEKGVMKMETTFKLNPPK